MSKKTLLSEAQIQRFMKLAAMPALGRPLTKTGRLSEVMEDDPEGLDPVGDIPADAADMADEALPAPMDGPDASGVDIEGLVTAIADTIQKETGVPIEVEGEGAGDMGDDMGAPMDDMGADMDAAGPPMPADDMGPEDMALEHKRRRRAIALEHRRRLAIAQENRLRHYVRNQVYSILEGEHSKFSGAGLADQGSNSNRDFEGDDNRQSSAGEHHTGGGKAKASKQHMGGNSAALPLEESVLDQLTRRVAARLLDTSKK